MKNIISILALMMALGASAQEQQTNIQKKQSSVSLEYSTKKPKEGNRLILDLVYKHMVVGGGFLWANDGNDEEGKGKTKNSMGFDVHVGGNYRYYFGNDMFYVEGRLLAGYQQASQKQVVGTRTERHSSGFGRIEKVNEEKSDVWLNVKGNRGFYMSLAPRVGLYFDGYSVYAGAGWCFLNSDDKFKEIKFDDKFDGYYFTIGVAKIF